jgi:hypothetical protein
VGVGHREAILAESHSHLEENIRSGLWREVLFVLRILIRKLTLSETHHVITRKQDDGGLRTPESAVYGVSDIRRSLSGHCDGLLPLDWVEVNRAKESEHGITRLQVPDMHDEYSSFVRSFSGYSCVLLLRFVSALVSSHSAMDTANPATSKIKIDEPTLPLTAAEYTRLLDAVYGTVADPDNGQRFTC